MIKPRVEFILVAFHPEKRAFRELLLQLRPFHVIVVDNGGVGEVEISKIEVLRNDTNLGYGGGANVGIRAAMEKGAEWVVLLNQDVVLREKSVHTFVEKLTVSPAGVAGPFAGTLDSARWTTMLEKKKSGKMYISGSVMAIHREALEIVGNFYEPYFLYYEEVDLCMRAVQNGFSLTHLPVSGISHKESVSLGAGSFAHEYYLARNHMLFVQRCAPWSVKLHELVRAPKTYMEHKAHGNQGALRGMRDYILRKFGPLEAQV